jgi:threonine synthase
MKIKENNESSDFYFRCSQCGKIYPIEKGRYLCDECSKKQEKGKPLSGLLLVEFSSSFIEKFKTSFLRKSKTSSIKNPKDNFVKGDFRLNKKEKNKLDIKEIDNIVSIPIKPFFPFSNLAEIPVGNTPIIKSRKLEQILGVSDLYLKWEGVNLSGSFKDRASILVSASAKNFGEENIVVASTGNAASSMAAIGAANNQNIYIFAPKSAPLGKLAQILQYGAKLFLIDGSYDDAFDLSMKFSLETNFLSRNTGFNPFTIEGKKSVAFELLLKNENENTAPFNTFDIILVPTGDGVIISGLTKGFLDLQRLGFIDKLPVVIGVQAEGSSYIYKAFNTDIFEDKYNSSTIADSISVNSPRAGYLAVDLVKKTNGFFIKVSDQQILHAQHLLAKTSGVFAEPSSASTIAAIMENSNIFKDKKVVALLTGLGLKDINSALKIIESPKPIKNDFGAVMDYYKKIKNN